MRYTASHSLLKKLTCYKCEQYFSVFDPLSLGKEDQEQCAFNNWQPLSLFKFCDIGSTGRYYCFTAFWPFAKSDWYLLLNMSHLVACFPKNTCIVHVHFFTNLVLNTVLFAVFPLNCLHIQEHLKLQSDRCCHYCTLWMFLFKCQWKWKCSNHNKSRNIHSPVPPKQKNVKLNFFFCN